MSKITGSLKIQRLLKESSQLCHSGRLSEAKEIYQVLLKSIPNHPEVLGNLGTIELQGGNTELGITYLARALKSDATDIKLIINLANAYISINKFTEAIEYLESAEKISPNLLNVLYNKARALKGLNEFDTAKIYLNKCLTLDPENYLVLCDLGLLFTQEENFEVAKNFYSKAIKINPENYITYYNRGLIFDKLNDMDNALKDYNFVIKKNPIFEPALFNRYKILTKQNLFNEALNSINYLIELDPKNTTYFLERALVYLSFNKLDNALSDYDQVQLINPISKDASEAMAKKSYVQLSLNLFEHGWKLYENRWSDRDKLITSKQELKDFSITKKIIFIWAEQGLGDQILFSSLLNDVLNTENNFIISLDPRLINIFARSFSWASNIKFISKEDSLAETEYDFHIPIGSLGKFFRNSIQDFDKHPVAYLKDDDKKTKLLKKKIWVKNYKICGIAWKSMGNMLSSEKSLELDQLIPIFSLPNIIFVNLQYGEINEEIKKIFDEFKIKIQTIDEIDNFKNIDGLTSLINSCDFIITSSNVTAHIAGALNKKTFLLVPFGIGKIWYWGQSGDQTIWYPSIEIFRKTSSDSWKDSVENLSNRIKSLYG